MAVDAVVDGLGDAEEEDGEGEQAIAAVHVDV